MRGLRQLVWLETKIFLREPMGVIGTVGVPVLVFVVMSRLAPGGSPGQAGGSATKADVVILGALLIALSAVLSLTTIVAIYREGGILKRLRATPLRPYTILAAHVMVKLLFTALTLAAMLLAGRRYLPVGTEVPFVSFGAALLFATVSVISIGFLIASIVPTARFAQPVGGLLLYPMLGLSGLFVPIDVLPPPVQAIARVLPLTYAVSLLRGVWSGEGWAAHAGDAAALALIFILCTALAARFFRWE